MGITQSLKTWLRRVPGVRSSYYVFKLGKLATRDWWYERTGQSYAATHLQLLFQQTTDPWSFEHSERARERFEQVWSLVPEQRYQNILEIGCAEGHFTEQIARRFPANVLAVDFIAEAVARTAQRCAAFSRVRAEQLDIGKQALPGQFDLIFCMGVLEFGPRRGERATIRDRLVDALLPGGYLVLETDRLPEDVEDRWWARRLGWGARALHDAFLQRSEMALVRETMTFGGRRLASLLRKCA